MLTQHNVKAFSVTACIRTSSACIITYEMYATIAVATAHVEAEGWRFLSFLGGAGGVNLRGEVGVFLTLEGLMK